MTCPRFHGLLVPETVYDGSLALDVLRCISCGRSARAGEQLVSDQSETRRKEQAMPGAWTPERRAKFQATMAANQGQPKRVQAEVRAVVPVVHDAVPVSRPVDFSALDVMIAETRQDLAALERAKEILSR